MSVSVPFEVAERPGIPTRMIILLGALTAFGALSIDMYLPALPQIGRELGASPATVQLTLAGFFIAFAGAQLVYGPLADRHGRRRPLMIGLSLYIVGSLLCAIAPNVEILILARILQGAGGAAGVVIARATVRDLASGVAAARAMSSLLLVMGAAPILAPSLGSIFVEAGSWRAIFYVHAAAATIAMLVAGKRVPDGVHRPGGVTQAISRFATLLREPRFRYHALTGGAVQAGMFAYITGSPHVIIDLAGISPAWFAVIFGANAFGLISMAQVNRVMLRWWSPQRLIRVAISFAVVGAAVAVLSGLLGGGIFLLLPMLFIYLASIGFIAPNATALALEPFPEMAGSASALLGTLQFTLAATSAGMVGLFGGGALAMASVMFGWGLIGAICALAAGRIRD